jgi:MerR family redox-sensitive transcriptional activator SoxR
MVDSADEMTIGEVAVRSGVATSALRFYEAEGLLEALRSAGNQRRYSRSVLRRVALIRAAQAVGVSLREIRSALDALPERRTPTKRDWERLSAVWRKRLDERIATLQRIRDDLTGCIGCGCLSLRACALFNRDDRARNKGPGSSLLRG